jgi:hypothetical protein
MQVKKLQNDNKSLENKLEQLIKKEASKSLDVKIQDVEKGTNTNPIHRITQKGAKLVEVRTTLDVEVQMVEIPSVLTNRNPTVNKATRVHEEDIIPIETLPSINHILF